MPTLSDEHLLMMYGAHVELKDGTRQPVEFDLTVGAVRAYRDDPNPCQCENCLRTFPLAMQLLALQEDYFDGRITDSN